MKEKISCNCGKQLTANTWKAHIKSNKCSLSTFKKEQIFKILEIKSQYNFAWLKSKGEEATLDTKWFLSVINGQSSIEDWRFSSPREKGVARPSTLNKMKTLRIGAGNPVSKNKPYYNITTIKEYSLSLKEDLLSLKRSKLDTINLINDKFPDFKYNLDIDKQLLGKKRGYNNDNIILAYLLDINIDKLLDLILKYRGQFISSGQKNSVYFVRKSSEQASKMMSSFRVTKPQIKLFDLIRSLDPSSKLEQIVWYNNKCYSFDVYSPLINSFFEMHGRIWHDLDKCPENLKKIVSKNVANDFLKKRISAINNKKIYTFWDDQQDLWNERLERIYGKIKNKKY